MKNTILFFILLFSVSISRAQFETGKQVIGGQLGFNYNDINSGNMFPTTQQSSSNLNGSISLSRFKTPTLLTGYGFYYSYNYNHYNIGSASNDEIVYSHSLGAFVSTTKLYPLVRKLYLGVTGTAGIGYGFGKDRSVVTSADYSNSNSYNVSVAGGLGLFYQLHKRLLLSANLSNLLNLGYSHTNNTSYSGVNTIYKSNSNSLGFSTGLNEFNLSSFTIGVRYILK